MASHSSILAWRMPWTAKSGSLHVVHGVRQDLATKPPPENGIQNYRMISAVPLLGIYMQAKLL